MHVGAVTLLAHWHYFKRCDLMAVNWDDVAGEPALGGLTRAQLGFVRDVVERVRAKRTYSLLLFVLDWWGYDEGEADWLTIWCSALDPSDAGGGVLGA